MGIEGQDAEKNIWMRWRKQQEVGRPCMLR
jgi:hypothetical protein